ncbi:hypothetical protein JXA32_04580 [Candidatus Sumerlaeota bacterium]|nr:hypothetical protein [Candidatus Sumerlaeota bacterium]
MRFEFAFPLRVELTVVVEFMVAAENQTDNRIAKCFAGAFRCSGPGYDLKRFQR